MVENPIFEYIFGLGKHMKIYDVPQVVNNRILRGQALGAASVSFGGSKIGQK